MHPLVNVVHFTLSVGHTAVLSVNSKLPNLISRYQTKKVAIDTHPLAWLFNAGEQDYQKAKRLARDFCPAEWTVYKQLKTQSMHTDKQLKRNEALTRFAAQTLDSLPLNDKYRVFGRIYCIENTPTDDPYWGEHHALDSTPRLINALYFEHCIQSKSSLALSIWDSGENLYHSYKFEFYGERRQEGRTIGYINGMRTCPEKARNSAHLVSERMAYGHAIQVVYNATIGRYRDYLVSLQAQSGLYSEPVRLLIENWNNFFAKYYHRKYLQICFSQGAIMVEQALQFMPENLRARIAVIAIAPACFIPAHWSCQVIHLVKKTDSVPFALAKNKERLAHPDGAICLVNENDGSPPHHVFGQSYLNVITSLVKRYLESDTIL